MTILYILYYILACIQHNGDVSHEKHCTRIIGLKYQAVNF